MDLQNQTSQYTKDDVLLAIMASSAEGIVAVDERGMIIYMTDAFRSICYTIFSTEPELGHDVGRLLIMPAANKLLATAINNIGLGVTASYKVGHNLNSVNFWFEISTYCSVGGLSLLIINDITELHKVNAQNKVLKETLTSHGGKLELLLQPLRIQSRHIVRALGNWSLNLTNDDYLPQDALVMLLQANQLEQTLNTFLATSDRLNKNTIFNLQPLDLRLEMDRLCIELRALTIDRYQHFSLEKASLFATEEDAIYLFDRDMLALIIYQSHKLIATLNEMPELKCRCQMSEKADQEDQLEISWEISATIDERAVEALNQRQPLNDQFAFWPKLLHPLLTKVYVGYELLNAWGGQHEIKLIGDQISLKVEIPLKRAVLPELAHHDGTLLVLAEKSRHQWFKQRLAITGLDINLLDSLEALETRISQTSDTSAGTIALMVDPSANLWAPRNGKAGWAALKETLHHLKAVGAEANLNLVPIAIQQVPDLYFRERLSESGFQQIVSLPFDKHMALQIRSLYSAGQSLNVSPIQLTDLDLTYLESLGADDPDFMRAMIELFLQSAPEAIAELDDLISAAKYNEAASAIHKFKSNLKLMGLTTAADLASALERQYNNVQLLPSHDQQLILLKQHIQGGIAHYRQELLKLDA